MFRSRWAGKVALALVVLGGCTCHGSAHLADPCRWEDRLVTVMDSCERGLVCAGGETCMTRTQCTGHCAVPCASEADCPGPSACVVARDLARHKICAP